ncbi:MAG: cytochrome C [Rhodocyclaceae bacterium]|nr:cytochrome C [Rhodocyclaceae bacterium]
MSHKKFLHGLVLALATMPVLAQTTTAPPAGRLLASNCYQCHGTNGNGGFDSLAGKSASEMYNELKEMQQKTRPDMMDMHARGYTDAQLRLIADYFSKQR